MGGCGRWLSGGVVAAAVCCVTVCVTAVAVAYPTSGVKNRENSFRILSARFILVKGEGKVRDARGSEMPDILSDIQACIWSSFEKPLLSSAPNGQYLRLHHRKQANPEYDV